MNRYVRNIPDRPPVILATDASVLAIIPQIMTQSPCFQFPEQSPLYSVFGVQIEDISKPGATLDPDAFKAAGVGMKRRVTLIAIEDETSIPVAKFAFFDEEIEGGRSLGQGIDVDNSYRQRGIGFEFWIGTQRFIGAKIRPSGSQTDDGAKLLNRLLDNGHIGFHTPYPPY